MGGCDFRDRLQDWRLQPAQPKAQGVRFVSRSIAAPGQRKGLPMFGSLARLALAFATLVLVIPDTSAHDSWISRGGHRNAAGEWCCGEGDCFVVPKERIMITGEPRLDGPASLRRRPPASARSSMRPFRSAKRNRHPTGNSGAASAPMVRAAASSRRRRQCNARRALPGRRSTFSRPRAGGKWGHMLASPRCRLWSFLSRKWRRICRPAAH